MILQGAFLGLFAVLGLLLGVGQLASLNANVRLYTEGRARAAAAGFHVARLVLAAAAWLVVARLGRAPGLLAAFAGFLVSRPIVAAWVRRTSS